MSAGAGMNSPLNARELQIWAATYAAAFVTETTVRLLNATTEAAASASFHVHAAAMGIKTSPPTSTKLLEQALTAVSAADPVKIADAAVWKLRQYEASENARLAPDHISWVGVAIDPDEMAARHDALDGLIDEFQTGYHWWQHRAGEFRYWDPAPRFRGWTAWGKQAPPEDHLGGMPWSKLPRRSVTAATADHSPFDRLLPKASR